MSEIDEPTQLLFQSNKSDAMTVKTRDGDKLGHIHAFMINKRSGHAVYAILAIGGFLGMGKAYYPLPFRLLAFEATSDSYVVTIDRRCSKEDQAGPPMHRCSTRPMPTVLPAITRWPRKI